MPTLPADLFYVIFNVVLVFGVNKHSRCRQKSQLELPTGQTWDQLDRRWAWQGFFFSKTSDQNSEMSLLSWMMTC